MAMTVVVALGAVACTSTPPAPGPTVEVPGPDERVTLFGTTVYRAGQTFEEALARQDAAYGRLEVVRVFYPGPPPSWSGSELELADRPVVVSFKLPPDGVVDGAYDGLLRAWFSSIPADHPVWWSYFHEPENDVEAGSFTAAQFTEAFRRVSAIAEQSGPETLRATLILQCRTADPTVGRDLSAYDPGADAYDVAAFDCYNRRVRDGVYPEPAAFLAPVLAAGRELGRPVALAELGSQLVGGDPGAARARWLEGVAAGLVAVDAPFVTYFDSAVTGTEYRLADDPSREAWRRIVTGQS